VGHACLAGLAAQQLGGRPHYLVRLQTFRQRAAEVSLVWRDDTSSVREVVPRLHEGEEAHEGVEEPQR